MGCRLTSGRTTNLGFSGMNASGVACAVNPSDTLDNPLAGQVKKNSILAKILSHGTPVGVQIRLMLEQARTVRQEVEVLAGEGSTFGWIYLVTDAYGDQFELWKQVRYAPMRSGWTDIQEDAKAGLVLTPEH